MAGAEMAAVPTQNHSHCFSSPSLTSQHCQSKRGSATHCHRQRKRLPWALHSASNWKKHGKKILWSVFKEINWPGSEEKIGFLFIFFFFFSRSAFERPPGPSNWISFSSKCSIEFDDIKLQIFSFLWLSLYGIKLVNSFCQKSLHCRWHRNVNFNSALYIQ